MQKSTENLGSRRPGGLVPFYINCRHFSDENILLVGDDFYVISKGPEDGPKHYTNTKNIFSLCIKRFWYMFRLSMTPRGLRQI